MERDKLHVLICDDDPICLGVNRVYVESYSNQFNKEVIIHEIMGIGEELNEIMAKTEIDIAFLDIDLGNGNGFKIASELQKRNSNIPIIFITSHREYTEAACEIMAMGYLKKPIVQEKFARLYERAIIQAETNRNDSQKMFLKLIVNREIVNVRMSHIIYAEKLQRKVIIRMTEHKKYEVIDTMNHIEKSLPPSFLRISQGVIVNRKEIKQYSRKSITMSTGEELVIGRTYIKKVLEDLNSLNG